eukprot:TRINITY_DN905_c0_g1_i2.p1 TRINITY_DN905_c0_g1~~TRINITY_DN905_c0_g1_i2.p1  ORF type:complete len:120 (+),score=5.51 TRINITY_DN905_c0_g1_i2:152-511(+)
MCILSIALFSSIVCLSLPLVSLLVGDHMALVPLAVLVLVLVDELGLDQGVDGPEVVGEGDAVLEEQLGHHLVSVNFPTPCSYSWAVLESAPSHISFPFFFPTILNFYYEVCRSESSTCK